MSRYVNSGWLRSFQRKRICVQLWRVCWSLTPLRQNTIGLWNPRVRWGHRPPGFYLSGNGWNYIRSSLQHALSSNFFENRHVRARTHTWCWIRTCCKHQAYCLLLQIPRTQLTQWKICSLNITNSCDIISYCCHNTREEDVRGELSSPRRNRLLYWFGTVQQKQGLVWSLFNRDQILRKQHEQFEQRTWKMNRHLNFNSVFTAAKLLNFFRPF